MKKRQKTESKLLKFMLKDEILANPYVPSKKVVQYWFNLINLEIFHGELPKFKEIELSPRRGYWGKCEGYDDNGIFYWCILKLHDKFRSKHHFIEVLAHEMVHFYEWVNYNKMTHGKTFQEWKPILENYNINLTTEI